jgi:uncharacterized protein (TIGR02757 family)
VIARSSLEPSSGGELKHILEDAYQRYACPDFVASDPIQIPKSFTDREDAASIGFITATIAWGQRRTIINNALKLVELMDGRPHDFIMNAVDRDLKRLDRFVHRTFNAIDLRQFILGIRHLYQDHGGLEEAFLENGRIGDMCAAISRFRERFFEIEHQHRTRKHVADPARGSNAKRINMFLRWMVRPADRGVDLGLWTRIKPHELMVPLDVHTGRVARELGLLTRKQDDWKAVEELTAALRKLDPVDPVRFDIPLFAIGVTGALK